MTRSRARPERPQPTRTAYYRLAVILGALTAMGPLAIDMYLPALPAIARELGMPVAAVQVSLASLFHRHRARAGVLRSAVRSLGPQAGALFRPGAVRRRVARLRASRPDVDALIVFRFLQALGGCAPLVVPRAVVRDYFDQRGSVRMLSVLMLVMGLGADSGAAHRRPAARELRLALGLLGAGRLRADLARAGGVAAAREPAARTAAAPAAGRRRWRPTLRMLRDRAYSATCCRAGSIFSGLLAYISGSPFVFIELFHVPPERYGLYFGTNAIGHHRARRRSTAGSPNRVRRRGDRRRRAAGGGDRRAWCCSWTPTPVSAASPGILVPLFFFIACHGFVMPEHDGAGHGPHGAWPAARRRSWARCSSCSGPRPGAWSARSATAPRCRLRPSLPAAGSRRSPCTARCRARRGRPEPGG